MKNKILSMNVSTMVIAIVFTVFLTNSNAQVVPSYVPTNGLIGWWPFNSNTNDESGNGHNGTNYGTTLSTDRFGIQNSSCYFNGGTDRIDIGNINCANLTVSCWINKDVSNGQLHAFLAKFSGSPSGSYEFNVGGNDFIYFQTSNDGVNATLTSNYQSGLSLNLNNWYHIVGTYGNDTIKLYVNGELKQASFMGGSIYSSSNNILFGATRNGVTNSYNWHGSIDDIGIWNRSLNQSEINALYNNCSLNFTSQPQNQSITTSIGSTNFSVSSSSPNATYQWQSNIGFGFLNINNAGQFSGAQSATLTLSNITTSNNNQLFRCLIQDGSCIDTSDIATLTVIDDAGITNQILTDIIVYPNPVNDMIFINNVSGESLTFEIYSVEGKKVLEGKTSNNIDVSKLSKGTYHLRIRQQNITFINQ
jgi:hypothetical protein